MLKPRGSPDGRLSALRSAQRQGTYTYSAHLAVRRVLDSLYTSITTLFLATGKFYNSLIYLIFLCLYLIIYEYRPSFFCIQTEQKHQ